MPRRSFPRRRTTPSQSSRDIASRYAARRRSPRLRALPERRLRLQRWRHRGVPRRTCADAARRPCARRSIAHDAIDLFAYPDALPDEWARSASRRMTARWPCGSARAVKRARPDAIVTAAAVARSARGAEPPAAGLARVAGSGTRRRDLPDGVHARRRRVRRADSRAAREAAGTRPSGPASARTACRPDADDRQHPDGATPRRRRHRPLLVRQPDGPAAGRARLPRARRPRRVRVQRLLRPPAGANSARAPGSTSPSSSSTSPASSPSARGSRSRTTPSRTTSSAAASRCRGGRSWDRSSRPRRAPSPSSAFRATPTATNFTFLQLVMGYMIGRIAVIVLFIPAYFKRGAAHRLPAARRRGSARR